MASTCVWSRIDHRHHARFAEFHFRVDFGDHVVTGIALAGSAWIAGLREEVWDDAMKSDIVVPTVLREEDERIYCGGRFVRKELNDYLAFFGV